MNALIVLTLIGLLAVPITWLADRLDLPVLGGHLTWTGKR